MAADLITISTTAALTQFIGPAFKHLGEQALERVRQVTDKAVSQLKAVGREPQPVEPKLLIPLAQTASLEPDPTLIDLWAALLANAADPAQNAPVLPGFTEVLRQLTPTDAVILAHIYKRTRIDEQAILQYELQRIITQRMASELGMTDMQFALGVDTLLRLRLCAPPTHIVEKGEIVGPTAATLQVCPTVFGVAFLAAVTPPTP
jgi:hypothetical protein